MFIPAATWANWGPWSDALCAQADAGDECKTKSRSRECTGGTAGVDCPGSSDDQAGGPKCPGCCE